jgi:hypothetical protein
VADFYNSTKKLCIFLLNNTEDTGTDKNAQLYLMYLTLLSAMLAAAFVLLKKGIFVNRCFQVTKFLGALIHTYFTTEFSTQ